MAEFGKGDPRWLVDDRVDGRNVNAWHWTERDCTKWCKANLTEKFKNITLCSYGNCKTTVVEKVDGEFTYCNRKRKHMFFYDLDIKIKWEANIDGNKIEGHIRIPSLSEDEDFMDTDIRINTDSKSSEGDKLKEAIKTEAIAKLRAMLDEFLNETKEHFKEPLPDEVAIKPPVQSQGVRIFEADKVETKPATSSSVKSQTIKSKLIFEASPDLLFDCLLDQQRVAAFTRDGNAKMERKNGGEFALFHGQVVGVNKEIVQGKKIVQKWRFQSWPKDHYSTVTITMEFKDRATEVLLEQTNVPSSDLERTKAGWAQQIWDPIRGTFGFNYRTA